MQHKRLIERIATVSDRTGDLLPGRPLVEIIGERSLLVENHRGISEYSNEMIGVNVKFGRIIVWGCNMKIVQMTSERLVISGNVHRVELIKENNQ